MTVFFTVQFSITVPIPSPQFLVFLPFPFKWSKCHLLLSYPWLSLFTGPSPPFLLCFRFHASLNLLPNHLYSICFPFQFLSPSETDPEPIPCLYMSFPFPASLRLVQNPIPCFSVLSFPCLSQAGPKPHSLSFCPFLSLPLSSWSQTLLPVFQFFPFPFHSLSLHWYPTLFFLLSFHSVCVSLKLPLPTFTLSFPCSSLKLFQNLIPCLSFLPFPASFPKVPLLSLCSYISYALFHYTFTFSPISLLPP
jgi:hypothetical protein